MPVRPVAIAFVLLCAAVAGGCVGGDERGEPTASPVKCPFHAGDLPERMSRRQVEACQTYFARYAPRRRFAPGQPGFSSQFCTDLYRRTRNSRDGECQRVRGSVCWFAVRDGAFASMRACFASAPAVRAVISESQHLTALVSEPAVFDGIWLDPVDNTMDRWFPDSGFRIDFSDPKRQAWDSELARAVPWPSDLPEHLARSPYVEV